MKHLMIAMFYGTIAQVLTFLQLQGGTKYNWWDKYPIPLLIVSIPLSWLYIQSVRNFVLAFDGEIWPSRMIGFGIGIIIFALMSYFLFNEPMTTKTIISILLALCIIAVQIFGK